MSWPKGKAQEAGKKERGGGGRTAHSACESGAGKIA